MANTKKTFIEDDNPALSFITGKEENKPAEDLSGAVADESDKEKIKRLEEEIKKLKNPERRTERVQIVLTRTEHRNLKRLAKLYNINGGSVNSTVAYLIQRASEQDL